MEWERRKALLNFHLEPWGSPRLWAPTLSFLPNLAGRQASPSEKNLGHPRHSQVREGAWQDKGGVAAGAWQDKGGVVAEGRGGGGARGRGPSPGKARCCVPCS